jgi:hypothetical protein
MLLWDLIFNKINVKDLYSVCINVKKKNLKTAGHNKKT